MSELRWILLGFGALIIGAIYLFWGRDLGLRRARPEQSEPRSGERKEPFLRRSGENIADADDQPFHQDGVPSDTEIRHAAAAGSPQTDYPGLAKSEPAATDQKSPAPQSSGAEKKETGPQKIVVLHVAGRGSLNFKSEEIIAALEAEGLQYGKFEIFHRIDKTTSESMFSVANMLEPGTFDLDKPDELSTPGISLFLVLPGPVDGAEAFSEMLITARNLAQRLGAEVLDEQGSSLSNQTAGHIREQILSFQLRIRSLDDLRV